MICNKCKEEFNGKEIHQHHLFPQVLGGEDKDGLIYLCIKCHSSIHQYLDILGYVKKEFIIKFTKSWLRNKPLKKQVENLPYCPICPKKTRRLYLAEDLGTHSILRCAKCGFKKRDKKSLVDWLNKQKKEVSSSNKTEFLEFISSLNKENDFQKNP